MKDHNKTKNQGGVCCKVKGRKVGEYHKGGKKKDDEGRGGWMCPCCGGEENVSGPIRIWAEEIYKFFFTCVFKFNIGY